MTSLLGTHPLERATNQKRTQTSTSKQNNPKLAYVLHTDASRGLSKSKSRYPAHKLEFLALKWAVTEKFADYLYKIPFTVLMDSNPLTYLLTTAKLDAASYRWLSALSTFSFQLQYRAGKRNIDADGLSRRPQAEPVKSLRRKRSEFVSSYTTTYLSRKKSLISPPPLSMQSVKDISSTLL